MRTSYTGIVGLIQGPVINRLPIITTTVIIINVDENQGKAVNEDNTNNDTNNNNKTQFPYQAFLFL